MQVILFVLCFKDVGRFNYSVVEIADWNVARNPTLAVKLFKFTYT